MGEAYRGLTIRFAADGTKVLSTLRSFTRAASNAESELRQVKRALKFDPGSTKAAQQQMKLLAEKAAAVGSGVEKLKREMRELGRVEIGGVEMRELSARTKDASTQASLLKTRYADATASLARLHNKMESAWQSSKLLSTAMKDSPFKNWDKLSTTQIQRYIDMMKRFGAISEEEATRAKTAVASLRAEFKEAGAAYDQMRHVAEYQSMGNKMELEAAKMKAAVREMNAAAKTLRATGFEGRLEGARASMERLEQEARQLKTAMRLDPKSFTLVAAHADAARGKIEALKIENKELAAEMKQLGRTSGVKELAADLGALAAKMNASDAAMDRVGISMTETKARITAAREELNKYVVKLKEAGMSGRDIKLDSEFQRINSELKEGKALLDAQEKEYKQLTEQAQAYAKAVRYSGNANRIASNEATIAASTQAQAKKFNLLSSSAATSLGMTMYSSLYPAVMMGSMYAIQAAKDVDSAYRDMRKTVQGSEEDFEALKQKALEFGDTHFTAADDILEIEAMGGQLGVTVDNLESFSKVVSDLSIAADEAFETEDIALWMGKMTNIMHIASSEYDNFADSLVRLGNSEPALESDIAAITSRFAGMATLVGSTPDEILAIATAATATGQKAEAAGGSLQRTFGRIEGAVAGVSQGLKDEAASGEEAEEALEAIAESQGKLEGFAQVAGMTAESFSALWKSDATSAFQNFVNGLKRIKDEGGSVDKTLQDLGITGVRDRQLLEGLTNTTQVLADSLVMSKNAYNGVSDTWGNAGDAAREANNKSQGFSGTLQIMINNGQHLASMMAESLVPTLKAITEVIQGLVSAFDSLDPGVKSAITTSLMLSAAAGPVLTAYGAMSNAVRSAKASWAQYTSAENKVARMEGSMIMTATGATRKYKDYSKAIDKNKKSYSNMSKAQANYMKAFGKESPVIASRQKELSKTISKQERFNSVMNKASGALGFLKGIGSMAAFSIAAIGIEQTVTAIADYVHKANEYRNATDGMRQAAQKLGDISFGKTETGLKTITDESEKYRQETEELIKTNSEFVNSVNKKMDGVEENGMLADHWAQQITALSEGFHGTQSDMAALQTAVEQYNTVTGASVKVVDELTGRLNTNSAELAANAEAYKQNMLAKAYTDVATDAAKMEAESTVKAAMAQDKLNEAYQQRKEIMSGMSESQLNSYYQGDFVPAELSQIDANIAALEQERDVANATASSASELKEKSLDMAEAQNTVAANATKQAEAMRSAKAYMDLLIGDGPQKFTQMAEKMGYGADELDKFAGDLAQAGISAQEFSTVSVDTMSQWVSQAVEAKAGINGLVQAYNVVNDFQLKPKDVKINDQGLVEAKGHIIDLNNQTIDGKTFTVDDNGTVVVEGQKLEGLKMKADAIPPEKRISVTADTEQASARLDALVAKLPKSLQTSVNVMTGTASNALASFKKALGGSSPATTQVNATGNVIDGSANKAASDMASTVSQLQSKSIDVEADVIGASKVSNLLTYVRALSSKSIEITTTYVEKHVKQAAGGINMTPMYQVPAYASGAAMNGIVTRATMTNQGLVGEAGTEALLRMGHKTAVVPLSNRRYVRPFARAVAAEMGGSQQPIQNNVTKISINGINVDASSKMGAMVRELADYAVQNRRAG